MKKTNLKNLFAIVILLFVSGIDVSGQSSLVVSIKNDSGEDRKLCIYNVDDKAGIVPKRCFQMKKGEGTLWERGNDRSKFMVKIFKPALLDSYLYTRRLPGDTNRIIIGEGGRFGYGREDAKPAPRRYFLRVCNQQYDQKIYFVLGFETNKGFWTEGWWNLEKGECLNFPVSEHLKEKWGLDYGNLPAIYYYAKITGEKPLVWQGGESDENLCINLASAFEKRQFQTNANGKQEPLPCTGQNDSLVTFRQLGGPDPNTPTFYLTF